MKGNELLEKQSAEKMFHDKKFAAAKKRKSYYDVGFKRFVFQQMIDKMGDLSGKQVLEYGCGTGWFTKILAEKGAEVWAFDISSKAVERTWEYVKSYDLHKKVHVDIIPGEKLSYETGSFDIVVGNAILHHLDIEPSIKEISRVLKTGGRAFFTEPLGHNPFLNLYRLMTPHLRSKDERPITFDQFDVMAKHFKKFIHDDYYLTACFSVLWHFIGFSSMMLYSRDALYTFDKIILKYLPQLRRYCWYSILIMEK